jgi:hypothetical protein
MIKANVYRSFDVPLQITPKERQAAFLGDTYVMSPLPALPYTVKLKFSARNLGRPRIVIIPDLYL